jgi:pyruvate dehydrogenase E1 component beta subunit
VAAEVSAAVAERCIYSLESPIVRITGFDAPWPQFHIEAHALLDAHRVVEGIRRVMDG